jgi:macrolide transport system ATP-binding/permease protein
MFDPWLRDARHAIRLLIRNPLFALTAAISLAIGIGANTTIFTIADALLWRAPAGVVDADRLVDLGRSQDGQGFDNNSYPNFLDVRARGTVFSGVYAVRMDPQPLSLGVPGGAQRIDGGLVSNNYFDVLMTKAAMGRLFSGRESEEPGATPHVVLSHRFWMRNFHGDRSIVGRKIDLNGKSFTVIGVAQEGFQGTTIFMPDLWMPMNMAADAMPRQADTLLTSREAVWLIMGGRLKPGVTRAQAQAELTMIGAALEREFPEANRGRGLRVEPISPIPGNGAPVALFLTGLSVVAGLVLAVACANVAGVLLARATTRRREIAVRLAIGAGRAQLVRQMLVETVILFFGSAALGLALARVMTTLLLALLPSLPVQVGISMSLDAKGIAYTFGLSLIAAILSGLAPALQASKGDVVTALKADAQGGRERQRLRNAFVVAQVALSIVLVISAALFVRALRRADTIDAGFDPHGVELASLDLSLGGYTEETGPLFARELATRVRALPGVENATVAAMLPLAMGGLGLGGLSLPGTDPRQSSIDADWNVVEPRFFTTLRTPILRGRDFDDTDRAQSQPVAIVNETLARRAWPGQDAIGKVLVQQIDADSSRNLTIVGVARDAKYRTLGEAPRNYIYVPLQQQYLPRLTIVARATYGQRLAGDLRALLASMSPNLPIVTSHTLEESAAVALLPQRVAAAASGILGIVGLLLAAIGIYGVTAYMVTTRTREIGIRMALGAERGDVLSMVIRQGMKLVVIGVMIGALLAAGASRLIRGLLFGIGAVDPIAFAASAALFCVIGLLACFVPARRATRIEAAEALRAE